jgi:hypothetical protein
MSARPQGVFALYVSATQDDFLEYAGSLRERLVSQSRLAHILNVMPCDLLEIYGRFGVTRDLHPQDRRIS